MVALIMGWVTLRQNLKAELANFADGLDVGRAKRRGKIMPTFLPAFLDAGRVTSRP